MIKQIIKKTALWVILILYLGVVSGFVANHYDGILCNSAHVKINDSTKAHFLVQDDIINLLNKKDIKYLGLPLSEINLSKIEEDVKNNQIVKECKAFTGGNGSLNIEITQRDPIGRIIDGAGRGYYIDRNGDVITLSSRFTPFVIVVNGHIKTPFKIGGPVNINSLGDTKSEQKLKDIYTLVSFIASNKLWNAQIVQVFVNKSGEFELIPRVGPHVILLGGVDNYQEKFEKLEVFYKEGLNYTGWNQYLKINLKFKDQVVCTKI